MAETRLYTLNEVLNEALGPIGTMIRDEHERQVADAIHAYEIGLAIKKARIQNNLTQEELGSRIGVNKSQISKLENGHSITISTMGRVFKALGINTATVDLGANIGKVALW